MNLALAVLLAVTILAIAPSTEQLVMPPAYARLLSAGDLRAVADFLNPGPGANWARTLGDTQKAAGAAGGSVGADADGQAYDAVLKRLNPKTGLLP